MPKQEWSKDGNKYPSCRLGNAGIAVLRERERERKFNLSIQPALAYEDVSMLESSAKLRMAAKQ